MKECLSLDQATLKGLWNEEQWSKELLDPGRICLGIFESKKLIALCCSWLVLDELHLTAIAVHPKHRKKGLARLVLSEMLKKGERQGAKQATLEVEQSNLAALALYKKEGFITAGIRKAYYKNGSDAVIQWKKLNQS